MAIAWFVSLGGAFQQRFEKSRLFQFFSLVCGLAVISGVMQSIIATIMGGLLSLIMFNPFSDMRLVDWFFAGALLGVILGIILYLHKNALNRYPDDVRIEK
ncbi:MAG: hypothetical protein V1668_00750 [Patescibacteria group bacterium]